MPKKSALSINWCNWQKSRQQLTAQKRKCMTLKSFSLFSVCFCTFVRCRLYAQCSYALHYTLSHISSLQSALLLWLVTLTFGIISLSTKMFVLLHTLLLFCWARSHNARRGRVFFACFCFLLVEWKVKCFYFTYGNNARRELGKLWKLSSCY